MFAEGLMRRVASITTVCPRRLEAVSVNGVKETAGSPVSTVMEAELKAVVVTKPLELVIIDVPATARGSDGTGVDAITTWKVSVETAGVGVGVPGSVVGVGVLVDGTVGVADAVLTGVFVRVGVNVFVGVGVRVAVGVCVGVLVTAAVAVGVGFGPPGL